MFDPHVLMRRNGGDHEAFVKDHWQPTTAIMRWMTGNNDFVESLTEAEARALAPAAFTT